MEGKYLCFMRFLQPLYVNFIWNETVCASAHRNHKFLFISIFIYSFFQLSRENIDIISQFSALRILMYSLEVEEEGFFGTYYLCHFLERRKSSLLLSTPHFFLPWISKEVASYICFPWHIMVVIYNICDQSGKCIIIWENIRKMGKQK